MYVLRHAARLHGYLDHVFRAIAEKLIGLLDFVEREGMRQQVVMTSAARRAP
jgi:hypothetical protein